MNRLEHIDILKGLAIFLMVMGHILSWSALESGGERTIDSWFIREVIYSFHMPLFMFMSGYVIDLKGKDWNIQICLDTIKSRFGSLIIPCISWKVVAIITTIIVGSTVVLTWDCPWFLRALFEIIIVFIIVEFISRRFGKYSKVVEPLLFIFAYIIIFVLTRLYRESVVDEIINFTQFQIFYPFFVIGYYFRKNENLFEANWIYSLLLVTYIISFYYYQYVDTSSSIHSILRYIMNISGIYIVYSLFKNKTNSDGILFKWLGNIGYHSIAIYLLSNMFSPRFYNVSNIILELSKKEGEYLSTSIFVQILYGLIGSIYCVCCCLIVYKIVSRSKLAAYFLFGKK